LREPLGSRGGLPEASATITGMRPGTWEADEKPCAVPLRSIRSPVRAGPNEPRAGAIHGPRCSARDRTNRGERNDSRIDLTVKLGVLQAGPMPLAHHCLLWGPVHGAHGSADSVAGQVRGAHSAGRALTSDKPRVGAALQGSKREEGWHLRAVVHACRSSRAASQRPCAQQPCPQTPSRHSQMPAMLSEQPVCPPCAMCLSVPQPLPEAPSGYFRTGWLAISAQTKPVKIADGLC
jgi:hypothetical protein